MKKKNLKKRKLRKWVKKLIRFIIFLVFILFIISFFNKSNIKNIYLKDDKLYVEIKSLINKNIYCLITKENNIPDLKDDKWIKMNNNKCIFDFEDNNYNLYLKNDKKIIYFNDKNIILDFKFKDLKKYYAVNSEYDLEYEYKYIGNKPSLKWSSSDDKIVTVNNGKIKTISDGDAKIFVKYDNNIKNLDINSTPLIVKEPETFDFKKKHLPCDKYTEEENNKIDEILNYRANQYGYKTRAAAVNVARFLTLEFPYRINYFYENGRLTQSNKIDGEGRYYHVGMYLHSSRYKNISKSTSKPKIWGCSLYDIPVSRNVDNGLDCSGFVSWVLLNAGYDVGDLGAGVSNVKNLSQSLGEFKVSSTSLTKKLKVGDLLFSYKAGGHIAIIVGIDEKYFYVAQALWYDEIGVIITKATANELVNEFPRFVLMDNFYKEDGNLTKMWY